MKMTRANIKIDPILEIDTDWNPPCISAYIETWFDVDEKFGTHTHEHEDMWLNLYALYSPVYKTLQLEYYLETDTSTLGPYTYEPTEDEKQTIIALIEEKCLEVEKRTCLELLLEEE